MSVMDLNEEQFAVLSKQEQLTIAKNAVAQAVATDAKVTKQFQDAIRHYHRALQ